MLALIAGQSNALGFLNTGAAPYTVSERVQIWDGDSFETMRPGVNTGTAANPTAWGGEVEFANRWLADNPTGVLHIGKVVKGETPLAQRDGLDWSLHSDGELFDRAAEVAHKMQEATGERLDVVLWMQGETDAMSEATAAAYGDNLTELFAAMRAEWGDADTLISFGRIADSTPYFETVRWAQYVVDFYDDRAASFDTYDFTRQPDGIHYDAQGHFNLGTGLYDGWLAL